MTGGGSLSEFLTSRRARIDDALARFLPSSPACPPVISESMRYSLLAGGKRLRPILCIAAAETVAGRDEADAALERALPTACALEFIHTYSLIHDDLPAMDDDALRRGRPTLHVVHGEGMAILAGDGLLTEAFALMASQPPDPTLTSRKLSAIATVAMAAGVIGMVGGQAIDLQAVGGGTRMDAEALRDMHARKTGALIRASAASGAIMAGADPAIVSAVEAYGHHLGVAFQIIDDVLDVEGDARDLGKTVGKDARAGKPTYPAMFGLDASRRMAEDEMGLAVMELRQASIAPSWLGEIASWVVQRRS